MEVPLANGMHQTEVWSSSAVRHVLDQMSDGFLAVDSAYRILHSNQPNLRMTGRSYEEVVGRLLWDVYPDFRNPDLSQALARAFEAGQKQALEFFHPPLGLWFECDVYPSDQVLHVYLHDITARKSSERERERVHAELQALVDTMPQIAYLATRHGVPRYMNRRWYEFTGRAEGESPDLATAIHPDDLPRVVEAWRQATENAARFELEVRLRRHDGAYVWHLLRSEPSKTPDGEIVGWVGAGAEIQSQKRIQEALAESEERHRLAMQASGFVTWEVDLIAGGGHVPPESGPLYGEARGYCHPSYEAWLQRLHPDDRERMHEAQQALFQKGVPLQELYRVVWNDGSVHWLSSRGTLFRDDQGRPWKAIGVVRDVTERHTAETERRQAQASLRLAMKAGRMGWWSRNLKTGEVLWSAEMEELFGLAPGSFSGTEDTFLSFVHPVDRPAVRAAVQDAIERRIDYAVEFRFRRADGSLGWMEGRGRASYDEAGRPVSLYGLGIDITPRKNSEEAVRRSERRLALLLEASTIGVIVNDEDGRIVYANTPLLRMLGYAQEDVDRGLFWHDIQAPDRFESDDFALDELRRTGICRPYETEYLARDGRRVPVYVGAAIMPNETGEGFVGAAFVTDLTALKEAQTELLALNASLERKVEERTAEMRTANEALASFNHHVSHDLRGPLRSIVASSRILEEDFGQHLPEEARILLRRQADAARKLGELIDDLLQLARLSRQEIRRESVDLTALARDAAEEALATHPGSAAKVEVAEGLRGQTDPRLLRLVLLNLIENAVKYSPEGGVIRVGQKPDGSFFVSDEGIGFEPQYAERIFEVFQRLHRDQDYPGTGIGLANVRQIVERLNGHVWAESEPGHGSTFFFTLG